MDGKKLMASLLMAGVVGLSGGCATTYTVPEYDRTLSEAMNVAIAAGITGLDGPLRDLPAGDQGPLPNDEGGAGRLALDASYAAINYFNPAPGFSPGAGLALGLLSFLQTSPKHPAAYLHIIGFVPAADGMTAKDAETIFDNALRMAFISLMHDGYAVQFEDRKTPLGISDKNYYIDGPGCGGRKCFVDVHRSASIKTLRLETAPPFLAAMGLSYRVAGFVAIGGYGRDRNAAPIVDYSYPSYPLRLSEKLPEWTYFYYPPSRDGSLVPVIFNKGRPLHFVEPDH